MVHQCIGGNGGGVTSGGGSERRPNDSTKQGPAKGSAAFMTRGSKIHILFICSSRPWGFEFLHAYISCLSSESSRHRYPQSADRTARWLRGRGKEGAQREPSPPPLSSAGRLVILVLKHVHVDDCNPYEEFTRLAGRFSRPRLGPCAFFSTASRNPGIR